MFSAILEICATVVIVSFTSLVAFLTIFIISSFFYDLIFRRED